MNKRRRFKAKRRRAREKSISRIDALVNKAVRDKGYKDMWDWFRNVALDVLLSEENHE